jgi:hypothetical protein
MSAELRWLMNAMTSLVELIPRFGNIQTSRNIFLSFRGCEERSQLLSFSQGDLEVDE